MREGPHVPPWMKSGMLITLSLKLINISYIGNGVTMTKFGKRFGVHNFNKKVATFLWWVVGNCIMTWENLKDRI